MKYVLGRAFTSITKKVLFSDSYAIILCSLFLELISVTLRKLHFALLAGFLFLQDKKLLEIK